MKKRGNCGTPWCYSDHRFCEGKELWRLTLVGGPRPYLAATRTDGVGGQLLFDGTARLKRLRDALTKALRGVPKGRRRK